MAGGVGPRFTRLNAAPGAAAIAFATTLGVLYVASVFAFGATLSGPEARTNLVFVVIAAFTLWASLREPGRTLRDLDDLRPVLRMDDPGFAALRAHAFTRTHSRRATALGAGVGVAIYGAARWMAIELRGQAAWGTVHAVWSILLLMLVFAVMGQRAGASVSLSRLLSRIGREQTRIDLLDLAPLRPFARLGVRQAVYWFIGSAIASLLIVEGDTEPAVTSGVIAVTLGLGLLSLLRPNLGIHERLRAEKQAELTRVRREIGRRAEALLAGGPTAADPGLASLIAYEARIGQVREWPFDAPTLGRFALFFLIPVGSWIGGALVERIVDALLG